MKINIERIIKLLVRFILVSGLIISVGYLFFHELVFIPTHWAFQFFITGITLGIAYAMFYSNSVVKGIVTLFLWFILMTSFISNHNSWVYILEGTYICSMAVSISLFLFIIRKFLVSNILIKIIISSILLGVTNGLIIIVLNLFSPGLFFTHFSTILDAIFINLKIGFSIGLCLEIGIELAESIIKSSLILKNA